MLKHGFSGILRDTQKNLQIFLEAFDLDEKKLLKSRLIELKRENNTIFLSQSQFRDFRFTGLQNRNVPWSFLSFANLTDVGVETHTVATQ